MTGGRREPLLFGPPGHDGRPSTDAPVERTLFGWYDGPAGGSPSDRAFGAGSPRSGSVPGVVLCNPIGDDSVRAHRPLRHLAQRLTRAGFAVLRFDFHGTGDAAGDERQPERVETWLEDVRLAIAELGARSGATSIALVGLRLGATLAMQAAAQAGGVDSLVLWGPFARGSAYSAESTRLYKMHRMLEPQSFSGGPRSRSDGDEAFGFLLSHATVAGLKTLDVRSITRPPARRALLISDGGGTPAEQEILDHLGSLGVPGERRVCPGSRQFLLEVPHKSRLPDEAIDAVVTWLCAAHLPEGVAVTSDAPQSARAAQPITMGETPNPPATPPSEEPIVFGRRHPLFGILHHGHAGRAGPADLPPIVLTSAGTVHRIGPHRFYVTLARRWAGLGFRVLRLDLSGIGDSHPGDDGIENVTYPRDGYDDIREAMDLLAERTGAPRFILAGLCSGGDFAFQMGMRDPRVAGALILNPRTFCVNDLAAVETGNFASVLAAADGARGEAVPVPVSLRRMVERGVDTLLVVSENDPGVHYVDTHWGEAMRGLQDLPGFHREDVPGTDHNFTSLWSQERVSELCTEHLTRRYLA